MKKRIMSVALACAMTVSLLAGCGGGASASKSADSDTFKIGAIGPLTGGAALYGTAVVNAAELAVKEINESGGINGFQVEYKGEDDEHDAEKSVNAYTTLKDWGMQILIGTTTSAPCIAVAEKSFEDNIFQLTPSGSAVECTAHENVFRVCFSDPNQGLASAEYMAAHSLGTKIGVIYDSSDVYSSGIEATFIQRAGELGLDVFEPQAFTADSKTDFTAQLTNIQKAGCDVLFLPFYYQEAALVLTQANSMGFAPKIFSCDGMDGILSQENFDTSLAEGVMLLTPFVADAEDEKTVNFVKKYKEAYGDTPNQFAADSYDAVYAVKAALEKADAKPSMSASEICDALKTAITEIELQGITTTNGSSITWTADGEPNKEPKAMVIENGAYVSAD